VDGLSTSTVVQLSARYNSISSRLLDRLNLKGDSVLDVIIFDVSLYN
jgi:hypothetical protein